MPIIRIHSLEHPGVEMFGSLTEAQLRNRLEPSKGLFIAESPKVIHVALDAGYRPLALLCEERHIEGDAASLIERCGPDLPIYTGKRDVLARLTGYKLTRGVLCAMRRPAERDFTHICRQAQRVAVIDGVVDSTNVGAIFRSAAALGVDAVLLTPTSCDPLNRRSVRVSMGAVFLVPWAWIEPPLSRLHTLGFTTLALALRDDSLPLDAQRLKEYPRLVLILGTEGDGLSDTTINDAHHVVRIPMSHAVDSLNVAAASAIAFWELRSRSSSSSPLLLAP